KDGWLYSVEEHGILRKWNPVTGQQLAWSSLSDMETLWAFSHDARVLASASDDLTIWDASSGVLLTSINQPCWVTALEFNPDASFIATGHDDGGIGYWDAPGHYPVFDKGLTFHKKPISALAISPDGKKLAAASEDKTVSLWDLTNGKYIGCLSGHTDRIPALAWHPNGKFLVSAGWDTTARVWDAATLQPVFILNTHAIQVNAAAFSGDGRWLACADSNSTIHVWDFDSKKTIHKLKVPQAEIRTLAFSPDDKYLAANGDRIIHVWNPVTGQPYADIGPRPLAKTSVSAHRDGIHLLTNAGGGAMRIWNTNTRQQVLNVNTPETIHALAYSPDGKWIAGAAGSKVRIWDHTGKPLADWDGPDDPITILAFSPDSNLLASASTHGDTVWVWRVADGEPILLIPDANNGCAIQALAFLPDSKRLAIAGIDWMETGGNNGAVSIWDIGEKAEISTFVEGATALAVHPSGDILATTTLDHSICLWDVHLKQLSQELIGHDAPATALAFSPDGNLLVSGSEDNTLRIWDSKGHEKACFEVESQVTSLAFSPDGKSLFAGHANTTCSQMQLHDLLRDCR
ncbi:MAG TPA: WD40 repeat domain-containing protein, partial [Gemmataceae bacterium]|nr:WD40 repeat domain-containing protein [Gemmataceae bacterium]